ncbi:MAG: TSUP family transporter, partial [Myxococcota bacterium]
MIIVVWGIWAVVMSWGDRWSLFASNWVMTLTMVAGSFVAGASSEGGGAVAFPAMTLALSVPPSVARDFALMIQTVGMSAAALGIIASGTRIVWSALWPATVGGAFGVVVGLNWVAPHVGPAHAKLFFVSLWASFGIALYLVGRTEARAGKVRGWRDDASVGSMDTGVMVVLGIVGGIVTSITGSGLDIVMFSFLVLCLNVGEVVATPTSVVLMAINAASGFAYKCLWMDGMAPQAWDYWFVCIPVVVVGAPLGARFIRGRSHAFVRRLLQSIIVVQLLGALLII